MVKTCFFKECCWQRKKRTKTKNNDNADLQNKRLALKFKFQRNASKFPIFI